MKDIDLFDIRKAIKSGRLETELYNDGSIYLYDNQTQECILIGKAKNVGMYCTARIEMEKLP